MPYKKKAPAKRTKKAVGGALSAVQKRMLGQVQKEMVNRGAGAITKEVVGMTRKYGDQRKLATVATPKRKAPSKSSKDQMARAAIARGVPRATGKKIVAIPKKRPNLGGIKIPAGTKAPLGRGTKGPAKRGGIAMSKAARANLMRMQREAFKTGKSNPKLAALTKKHGMLVKRGDAQKQMQSQVNKRRAPTAAQLAAAKRRGRMTLAQKRAQQAAAKRKAPSRITRPSTGRTTPAQRRARLLAARRRMAAMRRRAPTRRPNTRSQNLAARKAASTRRRGRAGVGRRVGAPTSRRGRPSTTTRQRRFFGGMIAGIRKATKRKASSPMRAMLTGVKTKSAGGSALRNKLTGSRLKKQGILGKTRTAVGKKLAAGSKVSKSTYKGRGFLGAIKARKTASPSRNRGVFGSMFGRPSRPASGGMRRVGGILVMGKAMTAPKPMVKSPTSPTIIKVPKTKYGVNTGTDPYKKAMNRATRM